MPAGTLSPDVRTIEHMVDGGANYPGADLGTTENVSVLDDHRPFATGEIQLSGSTQATVERIALGLPGVTKEEHRFAFYVLRSGRRRPLAWEWLAADLPGGARLPRPEALVIRTASLEDRDRMIEADPQTFFADLHYAGYPCVIARLDQISERDLARALTAAWRTQALVRSAGPNRRRRSVHPELPLTAA